MIVLSLFDGMSCGQVALERIGIIPALYFASEIDPHAIKVAKKNYPDTIHIGSVLGIHDLGLPRPYLLMGGSPCQGFSFAGKQLNFDDPRSKLFFEFVRARNELNPNYFLLENVRMKKDSEKIITDLMGVEPIEINSSLVSAQNRKRLYWTNIPGVTQPKDKGILLRDILEGGNPFRLDKRTNTGYSDEDKSQSIDANYFKGADNHGQRTLIKQISDITKHELPTVMEYLNEAELTRAKDKYSGKVWKSGNRMGSMRFPDNVDKKSKCLPATVITAARETVHVYDGIGIRKLTPVECERLQTLPDGYTEVGGGIEYPTL